MRYLILSDIHANWEALEAVLREAGGEYDAILCLGDLVGYGADPNRVVQWARAHLAAVVRGNHDKAAVGLASLEWFNEAARQAAEWTASLLTPENHAYLRNLPRGPLEMEDFQLVHGHPADEDEYLFEMVPRDIRPWLRCRTIFFGHTHYQGGFELSYAAARAIRAVPSGETRLVLELDPRHHYLINPGSVGQPRDGDPRAAYAIYDVDAGCVELRRCTYPVEVAQAKILRAGLPRVLAERLAVGY